MPKKRLASMTEQVTDLLRQGMVEGRWHEVLPGRDRLATELGCSHWTVEQALRQLAREGLLVSEGPGKPRRIQLDASQQTGRVLRVRILLYERSDRKVDYLMELLSRIQDLGHDAVFTQKSLHDLGMDAQKVAKYVKSNPADAWIIIAGSRPILDWFSQQDTPAFALFGRLVHVDMASTSPKKADAVLEVVDRLVELNHRRIVMIAREERRKPMPGYLEQLFLERLEFQGISTGTFNLPDWGDSPEDLAEGLDSLFASTPPTALIVGEPMIYLGIVQKLATMGLSTPKDVSLICMDHHNIFDWTRPPVTHIVWDEEPIIKRVVHWVKGVAQGKPDRRKNSYLARLVMGGTVGPAPRSGKATPKRP